MNNSPAPRVHSFSETDEFRKAERRPKAEVTGVTNWHRRLGHYCSAFSTNEVVRPFSRESGFQLNGRTVPTARVATKISDVRVAIPRERSTRNATRCVVVILAAVVGPAAVICRILADLAKVVSE